MNDPIVKVNKSTETGFTFKLSNVNVSIANGIRRTILSNVPVIGFDKSQCTIETNTSQFINEIIKHRLTCIPIILDHYSDEDLNQILPAQYIMELDVENTDNEERIVTTGDFILTNKETGNKVTKSETDKIFPKNSITGDYITFLRLRPKLSETIPGQSIKLKCGFGVFTAKQDSVYIPVSKCTYFNTVDKKEAEKAWLTYKTDFSKQFDSSDTKKEINEELKFEKKNFDALEMYRHYEKDSFDFTVKTTSFYTESQLVHKGCSLLIERLERFINNILKIDGLDDDDNDKDKGDVDKEQMVKIKLSHEVLEHPSSMENSFDIIMVGEDYTLGNILQYLVYDMFYIGDKSVIYCGFQKYHPHDLHSVLRVAYIKPTTTETLVDDLKKCVKRGVDIFGKIQKVIGSGK